MEDPGSSCTFFYQVLDASMGVIREDLNDWLQNYLFSTVNAQPIPPNLLLSRLHSGLWLARLACKLNHSVFSVNNVQKASISSLAGQDRSKLRGKPISQFPAVSKISNNLLALGSLPLTPMELLSDIPDYKPSNQDSSNSSMNVSELWKARNNVSLFLDWCSSIGIPPEIRFETTGLINHTEEKNVLLTLMEIARIAGRYGLSNLPDLVRMEREIDELEMQMCSSDVGSDGSECSSSQFIVVKAIRARRNNSLDCDSLQSVLLAKSKTDFTGRTTSSGVDFSSETTTTTDECDFAEVVTGDDENGLCRANAKHQVKRAGSSENLPVALRARRENNNNDAGAAAAVEMLKRKACKSKIPIPHAGLVQPMTRSVKENLPVRENRRRSTSSSVKPEKLLPAGGEIQLSPMHRAILNEVQGEMEKCSCCERLAFKHLDAGRYRLGKKVYYVRKFRAHIMVRVGGGWLTLEEFLCRHDPCRKPTHKNSSADSASVRLASNLDPNQLLQECLDNKRLAFV